MAKAPSLGERLKARRNELQLTSEALAKAAGVTLSTISAIENGKNDNPKLDALQGLAKGLKWSLSELLGGATSDASAVRMIPLNELYNDPDNPRQAELTPLEKDGLIASIRSLGLILPLAVRAVSHQDSRAVSHQDG